MWIKLWGSLKRFTPLVIVSLGIILFSWRSDLEPGNSVQQVRAFTRKIEFDFITWTWDALWIKLEQIGLGAADYVPEAEQPKIVLAYLDLVNEIWRVEGQINEIFTNPDIADPQSASQERRQELERLTNLRDQLAPLAESILQNQVSAVTAELGLTLGGQPIPPVLYHVTPLPLALIVSPRDVIRSDADISLEPDLTVAERAGLEDQVDQALNVSSLVVNIGGVGLYPTMVIETNNINHLAGVVSHEWVHNFLTLRPLGASYGATPALRIINETTASLAEGEIGSALIARFYPEYAPPPSPASDQSSESAPPTEPPPFDYRAEMHETRVTVDEMLAEDKIEEAEAYMEARRQIFWENGYRIRKINQAFFAFYGAYADLPGGAAGASEDPIGDAVRALRAQSSSLADFLNRISWMWSWAQLQAAVAKE